jgi:asparagine synthetase B (glutamine-hydrolysing)
MCGFAGIWTRNTTQLISSENLLLIGNEISNRGPEDEGTWVDGHLKPEQVMKLWNEHLSGKRSWAAVLWNILIFQAWLEKRR